MGIVLTGASKVPWPAPIPFDELETLDSEPIRPNFLLKTDPSRPLMLFAPLKCCLLIRSASAVSAASSPSTTGSTCELVFSVIAAAEDTLSE